MYKYHIDFSKYKLRDFEKKLALKEFENQFPIIKNKIVTDNGISFTSTKPLDESLIRKLTFYSKYNFQIAYLVTKAKVDSLALKLHEMLEIEKMSNNISKNSEWEKVNIEDYKETYDVDYLKSWFPENNLKKILFIKKKIQKLSSNASQNFVKVLLSNLLRNFSFQEPTQLRVRRRVNNPPENLIETYIKSIFEQIDNLKAFQRLNHYELDSKIEVYLGDVKTLMKSANLEKNSIDAVITSPPYATALPYIDTDRLSLFVFGYTNKKSFRQLEETLVGNREITKSKRKILEEELVNNFHTSLLPIEIITLLKKIYFLNKQTDVGFRRKNTAALLYKYFTDMQIGINQVSKVLKKNKFAFFIVGNNRTTAGNEQIRISTDDFICMIAVAYSRTSGINRIYNGLIDFINNGGKTSILFQTQTP